MAISFFDLLKLTGRSLHKDWVRSSLTGLGVFMGVAAVSATLNIAAITNTQIEQKLAERDRPYIQPWMQPAPGFDWPELTQDDPIALKRAIPEIRTISEVAWMWTDWTIEFERNVAKDADIQGVSQNYIDTTGRRILKGRFFNRMDFEQYRSVAIVDEMLVTNLFEQTSPVNQPIYANGIRLLVIGVVETKSESSEYRRKSGVLWVPQPLAESLSQRIGKSLQIAPHQLEQVPIVQAKIKQVLESRHPNASAFSISNATDLVKERELHRTSSQALAAVGLIALVISGIGIANITIAAVLERTKEIGLRRAIGATRGEIMLQFVLESVLISVLGGVAAIATVHGITHVTTTTILPAPYTFSWRNAAISMSAAIAVGVGSSFFPALRATQIDVVAALRE